MTKRHDIEPDAETLAALSEPGSPEWEAALDARAAMLGER